VWTSWAHIWRAWFCSFENQVWHSLFVHCPCPNQLLPMSFTSLCTSLQSYFSSKLSYLCTNLSPFVINFYKKGVHLIDTNDYIRVDGWHLNLAFLWTLLNMLEWHHLYNSWDTTYRIFDLDTNWLGTSTYIIAWVIHLINLSSCMWGNLFHLMIT
jgi:hypothetical protein